ncbi:hypothetical protein BY996DRAFT_6607405, partial [Phakopsora pachyrhizi]
PSNYSSSFGKPGSTTTTGQPSASKENGFNCMVNELNKTKELIHRLWPYRRRSNQGYHHNLPKLNLKCPCYEQMDHIFGFLPNVSPLGGGDPKQHTWALPQTINESTDEDADTNPPPFVDASKPWRVCSTPVIDKQPFRFPKEDEDIMEGVDMNQPAMNSDIITNDIIVPPLINSSTSQKTSNSWNLNPNSHQKTSKCALPPTTYLSFMRQTQIVSNGTHHFVDFVVT